MKEYDRLDAAFYDQYSLGIPGDVEFYVSEAQKVNGPVLELGCGTGRTLIPMAEHGARVVGIDRSRDMLARARKKLAALAASTRRRIKLVRADMRDFQLDQKFDLITIPYRAFLHLLTPADERATLVNIRDHLSDRGRLVIDLFDPRVDLIAAHLGPLGAAVKKDDEFIHPETKRHVVVWDSREYDPADQTVDQLFIFEELEDDGRSHSRVFSTYTLRYIYRQEMEYLLELSGYKVDALYGDFKRGPFRHGGEQIWVASKR